MNYKEFKELVYAARGSERNMTAFAKELGMSSSKLYRIIKGELPASDSVLKDIAGHAANGVSFDDLKAALDDYELLVVEDRSAINAAVASGELTPEEAEKVFSELAREGKLMNTPDGERYLKMYGMPAFVMGASDGPVIAGHSQWTSPYFLQLRKLKMVDENITPSRAWIFAYGHIFEKPVAETGVRMLRANGKGDFRYEECTYGYINTRWPHVLIHPDGFLLDRKTGCLLYLGEVKTAAAESSHWLNDFSRNLVPLDYDDQCQVMMEVLGMDECYILVSNKTGDEDGFVQLLIKRDSERAVKLLDDMEKFYEDTVNRIFYEDRGILPEEAAVVFKDADRKLGYAEIDTRRHAKTLQQLRELQEEKASLKAEIAPIEADIREIEKQEKLLKSRLYSAIGKAPGGTCKIGTDVYHVDVKRSFSMDEEVRRAIEQEILEGTIDRASWERIKAIKPLISTKVTIVSGEAGSGEAV